MIFLKKSVRKGVNFRPGYIDRVIRKWYYINGKKGETMKLGRLLSIVIFLLNRERVSAEELAARFEVTVRTIYRDMEAIGSSGIPVVSYPGKNGGYGIMENYRIDRHILNIDEILSIITALKGVYQSFEGKESGQALEKMKSLLPGKGRDKIESLSGGIAFDISPWNDTKGISLLCKTIFRAIRESKLLRFDYISWKGEDLPRHAEPITMVFKGFSWYFFDFCRFRKDFRFFKVSRLRNLILTEECFEPRFEDYRNHIKWIEFEQANIEYKLKFTGSSVNRLNEYFEPSSLKYFPDGSVIARATYPDQDWVIGFLMMFGDSLEVLEPDSAREQILDISQRIMKKYTV